MTLSPEQKEAVSAWIAAGDNLSAVQKKLIEKFQLTMTYRDVRFLVDDLNLALKDPAPKVDTTDVSKAAPAHAAASAAKPTAGKKGLPEQASEEPGLESASEMEADAEGAADIGEAALEDLPTGGAVTVEVDKVTLLPGALASGTVTFSDGVAGKWVVDQHGRPGFTEISQPGYRPTPADGQAFVRELSALLQRRGF
jgi:hypothetical protein